MSQEALPSSHGYPQCEVGSFTCVTTCCTLSTPSTQAPHSSPSPKDLAT
jgi:hypothetical protein